MREVLKINETKRLVIEQDFMPENPRKEWDNLGTLLAWHRRYDLSDTDTSSIDLHDKIKELKETGGVFYPVYMLDHSGLTLSITPFSCPWDSGLLGLIYVPKETLEKEGISSDDARKALRAEIDVFNQYLQGDVWSFTVETWNSDPDTGWEVVDGCSGFYGKDFNANGMLYYLDDETREAINDRL